MRAANVQTDILALSITIIIIVIFMFIVTCMLTKKVFHTSTTTRAWHPRVTELRTLVTCVTRTEKYFSEGADLSIHLY